MNSRKQCIVLMVLLIMVSVEVNATQTRLNGLAVDRWMVTDDDNIWLNPAQITNYPNRIWLEYGTPPAPTAASQSGGISWSKEKSSVIHSLFISRPYTGEIANAGTNATGSDLTAVPSFITPGITNATAGLGNLTTLTPNNKFDYLCGISSSLGISLNFANRIESNNNVYNSDPKVGNDGTADNVRSSTELSFKSGFLPDKFLFWGKSDLVFQLTIPIVGNKYTEQRYVAAQQSNATDTRELTSLGTSLLVLFRPETVIDKNSRVYSVFQYQFTSLPSKYVDKEDTNADNTLDVNTEQLRNRWTNSILLGIAMNTNLSEKTLLVYGVSTNLFFQTNREKTMNKISDIVTQEYNYDRLMWNLPVNLGLEYKLSKKIVLRTGLQKVLYQIEQTTPVDPDWQNSPNKVVTTNKTVTVRHTTGNIGTSLGLTFSPRENLAIEAVVTQDLIFSGTYLLSGRTNYLLTQLTLVYKFR